MPILSCELQYIVVYYFYNIAGGTLNMVKNATVSARVDENIKIQAEDILRQLGIPVSVVINTLYHQIIARNGVPFSLTLPARSKSLEEMTHSELDAKLQHSYEQALNRQGKRMDDVFDAIERNYP